jgi:hypothetical protein
MNFLLVGHNPLSNRGMNAALAVFGHFIYIGSRTDASDTCPVSPPTTTGCPHPHPGVLIVDASDPKNPVVVGEIGPPDEGVPFLTPRELRVLPQQNLLLVMNFQCSNKLHACQKPVTAADFAAAKVFNIKFFDLTDPVHFEDRTSSQASRNVPLGGPEEPEPVLALHVHTNPLYRPESAEPHNYRHQPGKGRPLHRVG